MKQKFLLFLLGLCLSPNESLSKVVDDTVTEDAGEKFALYAIVEGEPDKAPTSNEVQGRSFLGNYGGGWDRNSYSGWNPLEAKAQLLHSKLQFIFSLFPRIPFGPNPVPPMYGPPPPGAFPGQSPYLTPAVLPGSPIPYPGGPLPPRPGSTCYLPPHCYNPVPVPGLPPCIPICPSVEETTNANVLAMPSALVKPTAKPISATSDSQLTEFSPSEEDKKEEGASQDEPAPEEPGETDEGESRKKVGRPNPGGKAKRF